MSEQSEQAPPSLLQKAVRGAAWTTATSMVARVFSLVATLVVTHKIAPYEYGQASAASVVAASLNMLSSLWIANYLIVDREAGRKAAWLSTWTHQLSGFVIVLLALPFSSRLGAFFDAPDLGRYLPGAAVAMLVDRVSVVPEKIIVRDLQFRALALTRMAGEITYGAVTFGSAWLGAGGMSLIYGLLARSILRTLLFAYFVPVKEWLAPQPFDGALARRMFDYGLPLWLGNAANYMGANWDNLLVSRYFGPAVMATYSLAFSLTDMPALQIGEQLSEVLLPSFALLAPEQRPTALVKSALVVCLVTFPVAVGLGAVSETLVRAIFDARWLGLAPLVMVLSIRALPRTAIYPVVQFLQAERRTRTQMALTVGHTILVLSTVAILGGRSPLYTCYGVVACSLTLLVVLLAIVHRDGVPVGALATGLLRIVAACAIMTAVVFGVRHVLAAHVPAAVELVVEIAAGGIAFIGAAFVIAGAPTRDLISWFKRGLGRRAAA